MQRFAIPKRLPSLITAQRACMHALNVPDYTVHSAVTPFKNGFPTELVRELKPYESKWDFWTTSDVFTSKEAFPSFFGYKLIPYGQTWVLTSGKSLHSGYHFLLPIRDSIKVIKSAHTIVSGVFSEELIAKNGKAVEVYAVVYYKVSDFVQSAFYVDPESNNVDSEKAVSKLVQKFFAAQVPTIEAQADRSFSAQDLTLLTEKLNTILASKQEEFGLTFEKVEIRGSFGVELQVPLKIRALEAPDRAPDAVGHGLSNDYWADVLTPPFFEKYMFGGRKEDNTPAAVSLVWAIPSPPDFHHFNHVPRVCTNPESSAVQKA